ncbi:hypothetical protein [Pseudomonas putida]|uniref:Uncharacterized protein n=1 Tax=Pseudomonas putida TaxID=303 RepID=A0A1X0ZLZ5_PSEPU|nr:hypothetical protein [Pseudomonas putida]ORL58107.1 hypothetical protein B7H17_26290 [Pseudomonas putida]
MKKAFQAIRRAAYSTLVFLFSAALWIVSLFILGATSIVIGVHTILGPGAAFIASGIAMLIACFLLKRAVTNG